MIIRLYDRDWNIALFDIGNIEDVQKIIINGIDQNEIMTVVRKDSTMIKYYPTTDHLSGNIKYEDVIYDIDQDIDELKIWELNHEF